MHDSIWFYKRTEPGLWTVGYYGPNDTWQTESDHDSPDEAAVKVHYLNGGCNRLCSQEKQA